MYKKSTRGWLKHLDFLILDCLCLEFSFLLTCSCYLGTRVPFENELYKNLAVVLLLIEIFVLFFFESLKNVIKRSYYKELVATLRHDILVICLCTFYLFIMRTGTSYSRGILILTGGVYFILSYTVRILWKRYLPKRKLSSGKRSLLIVTTEEYINEVVKNIKNNNYEGFHLAGVAIVDRDRIGTTVSDVLVVADMENVIDYVCKEWVDEVFLDFPSDNPAAAYLTNAFLEMGVTIHRRIAKVREHKGQKQRVETLGTYTVLTTSINMATQNELLLKRAMDICGGIVGCIMTVVLCVIIGPWIYIKSPGPIFFSQIRVGKNGKKFRIYKFRSMYMDAEERKKELMEQNDIKDDKMFKMENDPRIIKGVGHFIRKTSLDEFPQFWNVLKGDMSLVGTRPPTVDEWQKYELHHRARLAIKPGLTGMWQVSGRSNITNFEEVVKLDMKYIHEWSFGLDIKLLLKTVQVVIKGEGSK
ncbi:MAG: sugar transferase [Eubacteriales bacterium]|nr:sugar transferase [Eubacteriales bacterium]